ncbi:MAG: hypothetical protein D6682_04335 [Zetaproteobacteria bacterium]|nr:MAG: hypothetical protein D6682_04335 [Zetaproteobacteria bacterium]
MNVVFTIDALLDSGRRAWRLCADRERWREVRFAGDLAAGDAALRAMEEVRPLLGLRLATDKRHGLVRRGRAGMFDFMQRGIFSHAIVHRLAPAPLPDRGQMVATLAAMEPGRPQLLYLDLGACFRSREAVDLLHNPEIAVRGEVASSPGFIGPEAAARESYVALLWQQFTAGWWQHLATRRINCFVPDPAQAPPAEVSLQRAAEEFVPERMP